MDDVLQDLTAKLNQRLPDVKIEARKEPLIMSTDAWPPEPPCAPWHSAGGRSRGCAPYRAFFFIEPHLCD